jgi:excinuclease ABC subunit A
VVLPKRLFMFDEPTTGLHFDDIAKLMRAFGKLLDGGHSLIVIEHNLDVIRASDWLSTWAGRRRRRRQVLCVGAGRRQAPRRIAYRRALIATTSRGRAGTGRERADTAAAAGGGAGGAARRAIEGEGVVRIVNAREHNPRRSTSTFRTASST